MSATLEEKVKKAPEMPGVYLMKDAKGKVLYVGKAGNLRNRLRAYLSGTDRRYMIPFLLSKVHDVECIVTATEKEALILENNLIKEHCPRYNVVFRDDKSYFSIRIDVKEAFPRFQLVRRPKSDGARYFGPYPSGAAAKETLQFLQSIFPLRTCSDRELKSRRRPCLEYEIKRCVAPCAGCVDVLSYRRLVDESLAFLEGREKSLIEHLRKRMNEAAEELRFEEAAVLRDRITAIESTLEKQNVASVVPRDRDVFGVYREGDIIQVCAIHVRQGKIVGKRAFPLIRVGGSTGELLSSLLKQYYAGEVPMPDEIVLPWPIEDASVIEEWLSEKRGKNVRVVVAKRGERGMILRMAERNAQTAFQSEKAAVEGEEVLETLRRALGLKSFPSRIECFDISSMKGEYAVGSMVTFLHGKPWKSGYRRYRVKTVTGADDYAMMYEVLKRRFTQTDEEIPDLVVVDGGRGHLGVAMAVLRECGLDTVDVIALAKGGGIGGRDRKEGDHVYLPQRKNPLFLSRWPAALFLVQRIRDEAHRFAIGYHRAVKQREDFHSVLDSIPGVGGLRKARLLTVFGDVKKVAEASVEELCRVEGIGPKLAEVIHSFFSGKSS